MNIHRKETHKKRTKERENSFAYIQSGKWKRSLAIEKRFFAPSRDIRFLKAFKTTAAASATRFVFVESKKNLQKKK